MPPRRRPSVARSTGASAPPPVAISSHRIHRSLIAWPRSRAARPWAAQRRGNGDAQVDGRAEAQVHVADRSRRHPAGWPARLPPPRSPACPPRVRTARRLSVRPPAIDLAGFDLRQERRVNPGSRWQAADDHCRSRDPHSRQADEPAGSITARPVSCRTSALCSRAAIGSGCVSRAARRAARIFARPWSPPEPSS
jgi:hypothetical protein